MVSPNLPLWLRFVLLVGIIGLASGAGFLAYRYYTRPATLSVAVGSIDGEAAKLGHGGTEYISTLLGCDPKTIRQGQQDLDQLPDGLDDRVRKKGAGRRGA